MRKVQFTNRAARGVDEVLSPFTGQFALMHRVRENGFRGPIAFFPGQGPTLMRIPQLGYSLETAVFGVCAAAAFSLIAILILGVN
jgi:hypothetical protein